MFMEFFLPRDTGSDIYSAAIFRDHSIYHPCKDQPQYYMSATHQSKHLGQDVVQNSDDLRLHTSNAHTQLNVGDANFCSNTRFLNLQ